MTFLLDLVQSFSKLTIQIIKFRFLEIDLFLMLQLILFFEINGILIFLFLLLLASLKVSDKFVETAIFILLDPLTLNLLLMIHKLIVSMGLLDTLI